MLLIFVFEQVCLISLLCVIKLLKEINCLTVNFIAKMQNEFTCIIRCNIKIACVPMGEDNRNFSEGCANSVT